MADQTYCERDQLGRKEYVDFLKSIIINSNNFKRDDDSKSFVMALDAAWGTGKTFTIHMLKEALETEKIQSFVYSAWKNDFWNNAFEPFTQAIFWDGLFKEVPGNKSMAETFKDKIIPILVTLGKGFAKKKITDYIDDRALDEIQEILQEKKFDELVTFQNAIFYLQKLINEYITINGKLIIIIDELDRCKPSFAVETMEIVKHIFDVPNLVVLFSLDIQQISCFVKKIYSYEMDAMGYILRFFDYISKMPKQNYFMYLFYLGKIRKEELNEYQKTLIGLISCVSEKWNLSLRELNIVFKNYRIFELNNLKHTYNFFIHAFYFELLILKFKKPDEYNRFIIGKDTNIENVRTIFNDHLIIYSNKLSDTVITKIDNIGIIGNPAIQRFNNDTVFFNSHFTIEQYQEKTSAYMVNESSILSTFIGYDDLLNWDLIKDYRIYYFIYKKLEMYDFSFSSESE